MSSYYYLKCQRCNRAVPVATSHSTGLSGLCGDEWLKPFIVAHVGHDLYSTSEYDDEELIGCTFVDQEPNATESYWRGK